MLAMAATTAIFTTSCENDNINPYDYANNGNNQENQGSTDAFKTDLAEYPKGSLVWTKDTILSESVEIPVGTSLYIEPGVTITCKSEVHVPVEIVVLGNLLHGYGGEASHHHFRYQEACRLGWHHLWI